MKSTSSFLILFFSLFVTLFSQDFDIPTKGLDFKSKTETESHTLIRFRNVSFGMSKKEIVSLEKFQLVDTMKEGNEVTLVYSGIVDGLNSFIFYRLINDKLLCATYAFNEKHTNENLYIEDYQQVLNNLKSKYGKPFSEDYSWSDKLYQDDRSRWGFAISIGHLEYRAGWKFQNGTIFSSLSGDNYKIKHFVTYRLHEYDNEIEKKKKSLNDF